MTKRSTNEEFIEKARKVHGDKYDYSKVEYKNARTKVCIICKKHGEFWQTPDHHLRGKGCRKCAEEKSSINLRSTTEEFVKRAREVYGDKYDYSKVNYKKSHIKVCIICPVHGEFWQSPINHLLGCECHKCANIRIGNLHRSNAVDFSFKAKLVHGEKYDYSKVIYINNSTKVEIICKEHGSFLQTPNSHLKGNGCPCCKNEATAIRSRLTTEEFIAKAKVVNGDKYDYSMTEYNGSHSQVAIICNKCKNIFWQSATTHLSGKGCPICKFSKGEKLIEIYLNNREIDFYAQYRIKMQDRLIFGINNPKIDFYLPKYNTFIEFNGIQHYKFTPAFHKTEDDFNKQIERDNRLKKYCKTNKIKLIEIKYDQIDKIDKILDMKLKLNNKH